MQQMSDVNDTGRCIKKGEKLVDREVDGTYSLASLVFNGNFCRAGQG